MIVSVNRLLFSLYISSLQYRFTFDAMESFRNERSKLPSFFSLMSLDSTKNMNDLRHRQMLQEFAARRDR